MQIYFRKGKEAEQGHDEEAVLHVECNEHYQRTARDQCRTAVRTHVDHHSPDQ